MRSVTLQTKPKYLTLLIVTLLNIPLGVNPGLANSPKEELSQPPQTLKENEEADLNKLAGTYMIEGKTDQATQQYQTLLNLLEKRYGKQDKKLAPILINLGSVQESLGNHRKAMSFYQKALALTEKGYGHYSPEFADNLEKLGKAMEKTGQKTAAKKHYKEAIKILSREPGLSASTKLKTLLRDYPDLIQGEDNSNVELLKDYEKDFSTKGNNSSWNALPPSFSSSPSSIYSPEDSQQSALSNQESKSQLDESTQVELRGLSASPANLAPAFQTLSQTIFKQSRLLGSETYFKRKIAIDAKTLGNTHPGLANDLCALALLYVSRGNYLDAQPLFKNALDIYEGNWGKENKLSLATQAALKTVEDYRNQGR
jgi:tetratricopeptide (TPR) repeat protein